MIVGSEDRPEVTPYPVRFEVEYQERQSRWKALFRIPLALPAFLFAYLALGTAIYSTLPVMWIIILVRGRIPRWLFDFQVGANRFFARTQAYVSLLTDVYPAFDGPYPVTYGVSYPERVSRRQVVIWKIATSLPHWLIVLVLQNVAFALAAVGWLAILFTGQFPKGLHTFIVGVMRWRERVYAYSLSLTDEFPPYNLAADAPAATGGARTASSAVGLLVVSGLVAGIVALILAVPWTGEEHVVDVSYTRLAEGTLGPGEALVRVNSVEVQLLSALDPADDAFSFYAPRPGSRLVLFSFLLTNVQDSGDAPYISISGDDFQLAVATADASDPLLAVINRRAPPVRVDRGETVTAEMVFEVPGGFRPSEVSFGRRGFLGDIGIFRLH
ncbi:MAG: DUF4389 domain-containing protein [Dehalococcoidia bacterium]